MKRKKYVLLLILLFGLTVSCRMAFSEAWQPVESVKKPLETESAANEHKTGSWTAITIEEKNESSTSHIHLLKTEYDGRTKRHTVTVVASPAVACVGLALDDRYADEVEFIDTGTEEQSDATTFWYEFQLKGLERIDGKAVATDSNGDILQEMQFVLTQ